MKEKNLGKFLSLILRHKPETIGISLDEYGWANVEELIEGINKSYPFDMGSLEKIVEEDDKQRFSFSDDHKLIRANQGHSIDVDVELQELVPPAVLYHGTGEKYISSISKTGLISKTRLYVHLSIDPLTAKAVGERHGVPYIYLVDAEKMVKDGYRFFLSKNGVWLTKEVPVEYLSPYWKG